jgi:hypothetical protein
MTSKLLESKDTAQVKVISEFTKELRRQIKIKWNPSVWGTINGYMVCKKYLHSAYTEHIGGPFTHKEDAEDFAEEYIDGVTNILLEAGELRED